MLIIKATVEQLIEKLQKIEDKTKTVLIYDQWAEEWTDDVEIEENQNCIKLV